VTGLGRRRLLRYAGLAVLLLALGGAGYGYLSYVAEHSRGPDGLPDHRAVRASDLWPRPVAKLYYPGSTILQTLQSDQSDDPNNPASGPARAETQLGSSSPAGTLETWYAQQLPSAGFAATGAPTADSTTGEVDAEWRRGSREYFELKISSGTYRVVYLVTR
jgi:hypothetical protein